MSLPEPLPAADVRAARSVSLFSVLWTTAAGVTAVAIGVAQGSIVLVAFGAVGFVDAAGSAALVHHFHQGLRADELSDRLERIAHRVVLVGMITVGLAAIAGGAIVLAGGDESGSSVVGTVLAAVSLVVLLVLCRRKLRIAPAVASPALRSDGHLTGVGAAQAAVTLAGSLTAAIGLHQADPIAAMVLGGVAVGVGASTWRSHEDAASL